MRKMPATPAILGGVAAALWSAFSLLLSAVAVLSLILAESDLWSTVVGSLLETLLMVALTVALFRARKDLYCGLVCGGYALKYLFDTVGSLMNLIRGILIAGGFLQVLGNLLSAAAFALMCAECFVKLPIRGKKPLLGLTVLLGQLMILYYTTVVGLDIANDFAGILAAALTAICFFPEVLAYTLAAFAVAGERPQPLLPVMPGQGSFQPPVRQGSYPSGQGSYQPDSGTFSDQGSYRP